LDIIYKCWTKNTKFGQKIEMLDKKKSKIGQTLLTENQWRTIPNLLYYSSCWSSCSSRIIFLSSETSIILL